MKRKITFMQKGLRTDGKTPWYQLVFGACLSADKSVLYTEKSQFVTEEIYKALNVGNEMVIE